MADTPEQIAAGAIVTLGSGLTETVIEALFTHPLISVPVTV